MSSVLAVLGDHAALLAQGFLLTIALSLAGIVAALVLAVPLASGKLSTRPLLRWPATVLVEAMRNAPFIVVLVVVHFGAPRVLFRLAPATSGVVALSIYGAAYFAEVLRGAFAAVPKGQLECARALGLGGWQALVTVVAPQMVAAAIPPARVVAVMLLKESAVLSIIAVPELTHAALRIQAESFETVPVFAVLALLYWLMTLAIGAVAAQIEAPTRRSRGRTLRSSAVAARYLALDWRPR